MRITATRTFVTVLILVAQVLIAVGAGAATYYVSTLGSDATGNGSSAKPWASIDHADANALLSPGDTVFVRAGTYSIDTAAKGGYGVSITHKSNGVTYQADPGGVIIRQSNAVGGTALVVITNSASPDAAHPIVFAGFSVQGGPPSGVNLWIYQASYIEVKNCTIDATGYAPWYNLMTYSASDIRIHNNVIVNGGCTYDSRRTGAKWYNNTFVGSYGGYAMYFGGYQDGYQPGTWGDPGAPLTADRDEFTNNIIASGNYGGLYIQPATGFTYPLSVKHDYNMLGSLSIPFGGQAARAAHESTNVDPMLDGTYRLRKFSPAIDAGTPVGLPYEWLRPDLGAFESRKVGKVFDLHTAVWYAYGADGAVDVSPTRWRDDLRAMQKAGLDGAWTVNPWADIRAGGDWNHISKGAWREDAIAALRHRVSFAESIGMKVVLGMAYGAPQPALMLDDAEFAYYLEYVDRVVRETASNRNVIYVFCDECINAGWYDNPASFPDLVQHHKNWCYGRNPNIAYWNGRWGTSFTWDTIVPAHYGDGWGGPRHEDYLRWMYAGVLRPRLTQIANLVKSIAPDSLLGYHEWLIGGLTDPTDSPLAGTDNWDFASSNCYGGYVDTVTRVGTLRLLNPGYPIYMGELGTSLTGAQPASTKPYLDTQKCGYNWWAWWMTSTGIDADQWNFVDSQGYRRSSFSLLPKGSQYGTIRGQITSAATGAVIRGAGAVCGSAQAQSVDNGVYRMEMDPGSYTVEFAAAGYRRKVVTGVVVTAGRDTTLDVSLVPVSNMVTNGSFNLNTVGWTGQTLSGGGMSLVSYDCVGHPAWGLLDAVDGQGYLTIGTWPSPGERLVYQDVAVSPDTTYRLAWWERLVGSKFDGWSKASADQWLKVSVDQKQGTVWGGPVVNLQQVQDVPSGWRYVETAFRTGHATTHVRIKFDAKFASGQSFTGAFDTPRVGIDCVQLTASDEQLTELSSVADAKNQPDGSLVAVTGVGTACFPDASPAFGYIESASRTCAIKVRTTDAALGNPMLNVRVVGRISTDPVSGEKEIADILGVHPIGTGSVRPLGMITRYLGGNTGLSTLGLLVRISGTVKSISGDRKSFLIDDGSGDLVTVMGFGHDVPNWMQVGSSVQLTGASSLGEDGVTKCLRVPEWLFDTFEPWRQ